MIPVRFLDRGNPLPELPDPFPMAAVPRIGDSVQLLSQRYRVTDVCWGPCHCAAVYLAPVATEDETAR